MTRGLQVLPCPGRAVATAQQRCRSKQCRQREGAHEFSSLAASVTFAYVMKRHGRAVDATCLSQASVIIATLLFPPGALRIAPTHPRSPVTLIGKANFFIATKNYCCRFL